MKKIEAWMTTDYKVFTTEDAAKEHEANIDIKRRVWSWVNVNCNDSMLRNDIVNAIMGDLGDLRQAIKK